MAIPLAERMRPEKIDDFVGQEHLTGKNGIIRQMLENDSVSSFILWGPPGTGKTSLAKIIAKTTKRDFFSLSAINSGTKDIKQVIEKAKKLQFFDRPNPILFIDEIHRFSKLQQDSLLKAVEDGTVTLIGATTENPSFEVIPALLSRCNVYIVKSLDTEDLEKILERAIKNDYLLKNKNIKIKEKNALFYFSGGDARKLLNTLELIVNLQNTDSIIIDNKLVEKALQNKLSIYDKNGDKHFDIISAFIKSIRGSNPDAAVYWLARMLESGEDIKFIARRMIISAAEDIGLANPNALLLANNCFNAIQVVGMPEARIILSETAIYLAASPKSNSAYTAINDALKEVKSSGDLEVPLHLRNAPTKLMQNLGYAQGYKYAHSYRNNYVEQEYLPVEIKDKKFYIPGNNGSEKKLNDFLKNLRQ